MRRRQRRRNPNKHFDIFADSWNDLLEGLNFKQMHKSLSKSARIKDRAFTEDRMVNLIISLSLTDFAEQLSDKDYEAFINDPEVIESNNTVLGEIRKLQPKTVKKIQCMWPQFKKKHNLVIRIPKHKRPKEKRVPIHTSQLDSLLSIPLPMWMDSFIYDGDCVLALEELLELDLTSSPEDYKGAGPNQEVHLNPIYWDDVVKEVVKDYRYMKKMGSEDEVRTFRSVILDFLQCVDIPIQDTIREALSLSPRLKPPSAYPTPYVGEDVIDIDEMPLDPRSRMLPVPRPPPRVSIKPHHPKPHHPQMYPKEIPLDCDCDFAIRHIIKDLHEMQRKGRITSTEYRRLWDLYNMYVTMKRQSP